MGQGYKLTFADTLAELGKGAGLLLILCYFVSLTDERLQDNPRIRNLVAGLLFGIATVIGMSFPFEFTPGVIFDARSVVIGVGSAFGGPVVAVISALIAAAYRLSLGGGGAWVGVGVVFSAAAIGSAFWWLRHRNRVAETPVIYLAFGFLLHVITVSWFAGIPNVAFAEILGTVGFQMVLVFTPATALLCLLVRDIEKRVTQHRALEERDADYQRIINNMIDAFFRADQDGRLTMISPSVEDVLGYTPEELIGRDMATLYCDPDGREKFLAALADAGGRIRDYETSLKSKDGRDVRVSASSHYCYDENGNVNGFEGTIRDITERRQAEEDVRSLAERLSLAANAGGLGIWDRDLSTGTIVWDRRMCELYSIDSDGFTGQVDVWEKKIHPDDVYRLNREIADAIAGKGPFNTRFRVIWPDGSIHHIEGRGMLSRAMDGTPVRLIGVNREVTEEVEAESRLLQSQKLEAVGQLTGGVAHDF